MSAGGLGRRRMWWSQGAEVSFAGIKETRKYETTEPWIRESVNPEIHRKVRPGGTLQVLQLAQTPTEDDEFWGVEAGER